MHRFLPRVILFAALIGLSAGLAAGYQRKVPTPGFPPEPPPPNEDPEVAAYFKKKGWSLTREKVYRPSDKGKIYLVVYDRTKPSRELTLDAEEYRWIARAKTVQCLSLHSVDCSDEGLKTVAALPHLEDINVNGANVTDAGVKALAQSQTLEKVYLTTQKVTDAGVRELAALPKLHELMLDHMTLNGSAFEAFAGSKTLERVRFEYVSGLTDDGARHLARLPNLKWLALETSSYGKLTTVGIKAIVDAHLPDEFTFDRKLIDDDLFEALVAKGWLYRPASPGMPRPFPLQPEKVRTIGLDDSKVTDKGLRAILDFTNVSALYLAKTGVTDETLKKLGAFKKLDRLMLDGTPITGAGLDAIAGAPLKYVSMKGCPLSEDAFKALGRMSQLEELSLKDTKAKSDWIKHLKGLRRLRLLDLSGTELDDTAAAHLATLPSLQKLEANKTQLGDKGFQELLVTPALRSLWVDSTKVSREVYQKAKKEHPKLFLYYDRYNRP